MSIKMPELLHDFYFSVTEDGLLILNLDAVIMDLNPQAEKKLNASKSAFLGRSFADLPPSFPLIEKIQKQIAVLKTLNRQERWESLTESGFQECIAHPYFDSSKKLEKILLVFRDIQTPFAQTSSDTIPSQDFSRELLGNENLGIVIYDRNFCYLLWSRGMEILTGIPQEKVFGKNAFELFAYLKDSGMQEVLQQALNGEVVSGPDVPFFISETGKRGWFKGVYAPHRIKNRIEGVIGVLHDITYHKNYEERMLLLNNCFLKLTPDPARNIEILCQICRDAFTPEQIAYTRIQDRKLTHVIRLGFDHSLTDTSLNGCHLCYHVIMGGKPQWIIKSSEMEKYPEIRDSLKIHDFKLFVGNPVKCRGKNVGCLSIWFKEEVPLSEDDRNFISIIATAISIEEERLLMFDELKGSELRYRNLTENLNGIVYRIDLKDNKVHFLNSMLHTMTGYTEKDIFSHQLFFFESFIHPDDFIRTQARIKKSIQSGHPYEVEYRFRHKNGEIRHYREMGRPVFNEEVTAQHVDGIIFDVTHQKVMEEEVRKVQQLESIGILAGGIAHDFNNLLNGILGNIKLAQMSIEDKREVFNKLNDAEKVLKEASRLTYQLLTFSKGGEPVKEKVLLSKVLTETAQFALTGSNVILECDFGKEIYPVYADAGQLRQVIQNLIINAKQAMPQGGIITLELFNVHLEENNPHALPPADYVKFSVTDYGVGITTEHLSRIFDPYFSTKKEGHGLGLAVAYSIISKHGGAIQAESEPGMETSFSVYLPAIVEEEIEKSTKEELPQGYGKILVMDDEEYMRKLFSDGLKMFGFEVIAAKDGQEAVLLYRTSMEKNIPFDAVTLDLTIKGGMGGKEAVLEIKRINPNARVVAISGYSNDPVISNPEEFGFAGAISKPVSPQDLARMIIQMIENKVL